MSGANPGEVLGDFTYFKLYTLDYYDGVVLFPGSVQLADPGATIDLRAQVSGAAVASYSWDLSGVSGSDYNTESVVGATSDELSFQWANSLSLTHTDTITLTVTIGDEESQTYSFAAQPDSGFPVSYDAWPQAISPDTVSADTQAFPAQNVAVSAVSGALDTTIGLPSYNPNVPSVALAYDSLTADPRPIVIVHHELDPAQAVPSQVSAQITLDNASGGAYDTGTTYYYDTSTFNPEDVQQIALQSNANGLASGRYDYVGTIADIRTTTTTTTLDGATNIVNDSGSGFGAGWTLQGLEQIIPASGGVMLDLGSGGASLWFTGSFGSGGGTFTDPAGEFSTLTQNSDGSYTRTLTDGTAIDFNTSGQQTAVVDRNGLRTTYAYSSGLLATITDPYNNVTTFTYSSGLLSTITDPAGRVATFAHTGSDLTGVTLPDSSSWSYGYDSGGRLTHVTDPNSHTTSVAYDSAERVATITQPDSSVETFAPYQEQGWTNSGTSSSPAAATLLAESVGTFTNPLAHATEVRADWTGLGLTNQTTDPDGYVTTEDLDPNGLPLVSIDQDNRLTQETFDTKGNPVTIIYPSLTADQYTYNSFSEPTTHIDANGHTYTYTYDSHGDPAVAEDPLTKLTTMTYTADGMLATRTDANDHTTTLQYDSQDRLTTLTNPDATTELTAYDGQGDATSITDERGGVTTYSFDAMDRTTGTTDALGDRATYVYDSGGNLLADQEPLSRTTSIAYDYRDAYCSPCRKAHWLAGRVDAARHQITLRKFNEHRVLNVLISNPGLLHRAA